MNRSINMSQDQILQWEKYVGKPVEVPQGLITGNLKQAAKIPFDAIKNPRLEVLLVQYLFWR